MPLPDSNAKAEPSADRSRDANKALAKAQRRRHRMQRDENQAANIAYEGVETSARSSGRREHIPMHALHFPPRKESEQLPIFP